jgi:hypothetical protein
MLNTLEAELPLLSLILSTMVVLIARPYDLLQSLDDITVIKRL